MSPVVNCVFRSGPDATDAAGVTSNSTFLRADVIASLAVIPGVAWPERLENEPTGEPVTLTIWPFFVTPTLTPLPKTVTSSTTWVKLRWCVPRMST